MVTWYGKLFEVQLPDETDVGYALTRRLTGLRMPGHVIAR